MGQEEVLKALQKANRPLTSTEIAALIDIGARSVRRILRSLQKDCLFKLQTHQLSPEEKIKRYGRTINPTTIKVYFLKK